MTAPSRTMPPAPLRQASGWAWLFVGSLVAGLIYGCFQQPYLVAVLATAIGGLGWMMAIWDVRRRRRLATSRQGESICQFARSFSRQTDTWLIRAVYEELSRYLTVDGRPIPVRQQDHCEKDLGIDPEDLDDIARDAAFRAGRSMDNCAENPMYGNVQTAGDIVKFLEYQPRSAQSNSHANRLR